MILLAGICVDGRIIEEFVEATLIQQKLFVRTGNSVCVQMEEYESMNLETIFRWQMFFTFRKLSSKNVVQIYHRTVNLLEPSLVWSIEGMI